MVVEDLDHHELPTLPAPHHAADLPILVSAILARPNWVMSSNDRHWNPDVARRTGPRIVTPLEFLSHVSAL